MKLRNPEFPTGTKEYLKRRRDAYRMMGFCPECSDWLINITKSTCDNCKQQKNKRYKENRYEKVSADVRITVNCKSSSGSGINDI